MKRIEVTEQSDEHHPTPAEVPATVAPDLVRFVLPVIGQGGPAIDEVEASWEAVVAKAWAEDLADPAQDLYTLEDGGPFDRSRPGDPF